MKLLPTKFHGLLDYLSGALLIAAPLFLSFENESAGRVPLLLGVATLFYSLFTRYEWGLVKMVPMPIHLGLDLLNGILLAASPWLFHFASEVWAPHLIFGGFEVCVALTTRHVTSAMESSQS